MKTPEQIIFELESDNSRLVKEAILKEVMESDFDDFFQGIRMALDPMTTFGIKQVPFAEMDGPGLFWDEFTGLTADLANRTLTGNAARDEVARCCAKATIDQWNGWYRRILIKDLRAGLSEKTVNKVAKEAKKPEYSVPIFSCQLAHDSNNHESKVVGKKMIEVKLDGVRVITIVYPDGRVDQFSRNGKELVNFPHIKEQFASIAGDMAEAQVFDGEVMSSSFQDLMKQVHRKENVEAGDAVLHLFDMIPLKDFEKGVYACKQQWRSELLNECYQSHKDKTPNIRVLSYETVDLDTDEGQTRYKEINKQAIEGGYEGIMIKDPDAKYECKRSTAWLKLKPFIEVTLEVKSVEEGTGRNVGRLGAFVCSGQDDGKDITVNVGSGFSDSDRDEFWNYRDECIGNLVEVRADAVTQNQDGTYSLRFPRFLRFRGFKASEKM